MMNHTCLHTTNYWAPLDNEEEELIEPEQMNIITAKHTIMNTISNKWTRRIERRKTRKLVIDSGATSNFVPDDMNLPRMGQLNKEVYLLDNTTLKTTYHTELPLNQLSKRARQADIIPGLKTH